MKNLKTILKEVGIRLVQEHGFRPSKRGGSGPRDTAPLSDFLRWVQSCPEARRLFDEYDLTWEDPPPRPPLPPLERTSPEARCLVYLNQKRGCQDATLERAPARPDLPIVRVPFRDGAMEWWTRNGVWNYMVRRSDGTVEDEAVVKMKADVEPFRIADYIWMHKRNL